MLINLIKNGFDSWSLIQLLLSLPIIVFSLTIHEYAHGFVALKCGDHTAESLGRLDLNPLKHLDPIGTLCMLVCGIGWAKPVPINSRYFRNPKRGMALTAAAGPLANLCVGFIFAVILRILMLAYGLHDYETTMGYLGLWIYSNTNSLACALLLFAYYGMQMNIYLAVFNLLPIPPFDGSRILFIFLPTKLYFGIMKYERIIMIVVLILLWTGAAGSAFSVITNFFIKIIMTILFA